MNHKQNCECYACKHGIKAYLEMKEKAIRTQGWIGEAVTDADNTPFGVNFHTHGFEETLHHKDIQMCFPTSVETMYDIAGIIYRKIKEGLKIEPAEYYSDILGNGYLAFFIEAREGGRDVLRLVFPDPSGKYGGWYAQQFLLTDTDD